MATSPFESALYRDLCHDAETATLLSDSAEIRAMLIVEGALAKAQGAHGLIPEVSAAAIHRASLEAEIDPSALASETGTSAVPVPALVKAFRSEIGAIEHAQFVHWGATSQDIVDTALILRLRQLIRIFDGRLIRTAKALGILADTHATLPLAGRTWTQAATPTSFGAIAAEWGRPLLRHHDRLSELTPRLLVVSLSGATGTLSAMGEKSPSVRQTLAAELSLGDPGESWHSQRDRIAELGAWLAGVTGSLAKMAEDILAMTQSSQGELHLASGGGSSTMPQKQNPVAPSLLVTLARFAQAQAALLQGALVHRQQRDGTAWMTEWLALGPLLMATGRALTIAADLPAQLTPVPEAMARGIDDGRNLIYAEALSFALAAHMPRPEAQTAVKALCARTLATGAPLATLAAEAFPEVDLSRVFDPIAQLGTAPADARAFAKAAAAL